jgi:protocadherin-15
MIGIEKFSNRRSIVSNGSVIESSGATDVWFYAVDPATETILDRNNTEVFEKILDPTAQTQINLEASSIARATAQGIFAPIEVKHPTQIRKAAVFLDEEIFPYVLIFISAIILILGTSGIVYICISWSRYKNFKQQMRQYSGPANPPRYDPVIINAPASDASVANLKEYETQVLGMAVNEEQDDMQVNYSAKNHAFSLDNVSYITHKENGQQSPTNSDTSTVVIGTLQRNNRINLLNNINNKQNTLNKTIELNRNNYANPLSIDTNFKAGTTLTLGRIKSERNQIING